jgi:glucose-6-phosphate dehydrogenase assembly protein OpcA
MAMAQADGWPPVIRGRFAISPQPFAISQRAPGYFMDTTPVRHVVRASTSETAEDDLSALWRELAHETPDTRAIMSNLVIFRERAEGENVDVEAPLRDDLVVEVALCHPSRVVLLVHARSDVDSRTPLAAAVGILTFGPAEARHAIEQIAVRSHGPEQSLPSIVRRLVMGDLPTSVWWTEDLSQAPPLAALATMGRQFVYDSRQWRDVRAGISTVIGLLEHRHAPDVADLNWRRLAPLRQGVLRALAAADRVPERRALRDAPDLCIDVVHPPGEEALACLLIGWLTSRFERRAKRDLTVMVRQDAGDRGLAVTIDAPDADGITATMSEHQVEVTSPPGRVPFLTAVPMERDADAIAAELWTLGRDVGLTDAVRAAHARFTRQQSG